MSHNQSRAEKSEAQLRKPGRSVSSSQQRSFSGVKGGGGTAPAVSSSLSANRSLKKYSNGQGGQSRLGLTVANSESSAAITASHSVQNGALVQSQLPDTEVSALPKQDESSVSTSPQGLPRVPSSQSSAGASDSTVPTTPSKGDMSRPFPLQFGSISPGFMNGMQIPARTSSAPPNLDEQKRDKACHDSFRAGPIAPIPSAPKQHHQLRKDFGSFNQSDTAEAHPPAPIKRDAHVHSPAPPASATAQKSSVLPVSGMPVPMTFRPPQVRLQFGGPNSQIESQGITPTSLQIPMTLPVGNASQVQQQVFVPGFQSHPLQPQGMMHQGQSLGFPPQMGHQLVPQVGNLGIGMSPQFAQQPAGKFVGTRKAVKITHPETHEELKLDNRTKSYMDVSSSGPWSRPNVPAQSQPITSFPINYYSYDPSYFFPTSTSLPLSSTQMTSGPSSSGYNYSVGQAGQNVSFVNPSLNPLPFNKAGHSMPGKPQPGNLERIHDSHAVVQVAVRPAAGSLAEKPGSSLIMVTSPVSKTELPKLLKQPGEASFTHHLRGSEIGLENCVQQPKSAPESSDSISLPSAVKLSSPVTTFIQAMHPSASSTPLMPAEGSASVSINAESRRESIRRSNSLKEQQKKPSKKELRHFQKQHEPDVIDSTGKNSKPPLSETCMDGSSFDINDSPTQECTNPDENVQTPVESAGTPLKTAVESAGTPLKTATEPNFSSILEHNFCSLVEVSESEEAKTISSKPETSEVILGPGKEVLQDHSNSCIASKTITDGVWVGQGGSCERPCPPNFKANEAMSGNTDVTHHVKQDGSASPKVGREQEIIVTMEHGKTENHDYSPQVSSNLLIESAGSESYDCENQPKETSQVGAATDNTHETDIENSCMKTERVDMNVEAVCRVSEVGSTEDSSVQSATTPSGSVHSETAIFSLADCHEGKTSSADTFKYANGKSTAEQEEVASPGSGTLRWEIDHSSPSVSSEVIWKVKGRGTGMSSGSQVSTLLVESKDTISEEQNNAKVTAGKKKKRKDILKKADAAGRTSDLYLAYKGPEEKHDISVSSECKDSFEISVSSECKYSFPAADVNQASTDNTGKGTVAFEDGGQCKGEVDDWEDAAEISTPKLKVAENREQLCVAQKQNDVYGSGITCRKYSRDFLLTFSQQCTNLPAGFDIRADTMDALMSAHGTAFHLVGRDSYSNTGRIVDRTGGSRLDRRGIGMDDKWSKAFGSFSSGHDPRLDVGFGGSGVNFRPVQGGNHGVLRNPRGQSPAQYSGGILAGPMQSLVPPGGISRNSPDADRWRATGNQKGLIPSPQTPLQMMHKADKRYEVGKVSDEEEAKQRQLKAILNKLTPQNFDKLFEQVKAVNIDNTTTLTGVISQIFDKALMEPTFCEMYANFCFHLATALPDFTENNEKITFKRLLLNKCQEEFERGEREQAEANRDEEEGEIKRSEEEKEQKKVQARRRMLGNIRLIGELYKKKMLTERIMHECIKKLLGQNQNPDEEDIEALCKLMSTIGEMIDHPKAKEHMDAYFDMILKLSNNQKLSSRVRFMLKDAIDLRKNRWQQRRKVEGPKKIEEVHRDAAQERQAQVIRLSRGSAIGSSARRGQPPDYGSRGSTTISSPSSQQMSSVRGLPPHLRGYSTQDVRTEDRQPIETRTLSVPLPLRPDDDSITLGPQGGLARGMSSRGQPLMLNASMTDVSCGHYDSRRMVSGRNGYNSVSDWMSCNHAQEELMPRYAPDRFSASSYDQSGSQEHNAFIGNGPPTNANHSFDRSTITTPPTGIVQGPSTGAQNAPSESKLSTERLRDLSISAIREFYSARNEEEVRSCIKELNHPNFYPDMVMIWVTDSFDRKNDRDRDLLAKLLVNLCNSQDGLLNQVQLIKGFETVLSSLEDAVTDSPKAAEYLGRILSMVILENTLSLKEMGRLIHGGGEEPGSLLQSGLASDVLVSILESIRREKGETVLNEIRTSSNIRLDDFRPPDPIKSSKFDAFI